MHIDDDLHVVAETPAHHFLDASDPRLVDAHRLRIGDVALPTDRNTDGIEASLLDSGYHLLGHYGIAPSGLCMDGIIGIAYLHRLTILTRSRALELIAQIPADDILVPLLGCRKGILHLMGGLRWHLRSITCRTRNRCEYA